MTVEQIESVLRMLESRDFERWYKFKFEKFVDGGLGAPTKKEILNWLTMTLGDK